MSTIVAIVGASGSGKSSSIATMDPASTYVFNVANKPLPFRGWKSKFNSARKNFFNDFPVPEIGSYDRIDNTPRIWKRLKNISERALHIKDVIIDDYQYVLSDEFFSRAKESGWGKFTDIGQSAWALFKNCAALRDDLTVFFLVHSEEVQTNGASHFKMKTIGKMLDEKLTCEGLFTVVLFTKVEPATNGEMAKHYFTTRNEGSTTCKSPMGMFSTAEIPNDLALVSRMIREYNEGEDSGKPAPVLVQGGAKAESEQEEDDPFGDPVKGPELAANARQ